jgi:hypothetical protein
MSWLSTAHAAFMADDLDGEEFFMWLMDMDLFDENPSWMELEVLCQYLDWTMTDLILFHEDPTPLPPPRNFFYIRAEE